MPCLGVGLKLRLSGLGGMERPAMALFLTFLCVQEEMERGDHIHCCGNA